MTGRAKRKPKPIQVISHSFDRLCRAAETLLLKAAFIAGQGAALRVWLQRRQGNLCWTLRAQVFGTLSERRRSDDNMAAALPTGAAQPLVHRPLHT